MNTYGLYSESFFKEPSRFLPGKLLEVVRLRANPRSRGHMKELFLKRYPDGIFAEDLSVLDRARGQDKVILLYPDATGLGFCSIENKVRSKRLNVVALNGRGRFFRLDAPTLRVLRFRRFLEASFLPELLFAPILLGTALILSAYDFLRSRT